MAVRLTKPWLTAAQALSRLAGNLGVFQLAGAQQQLLYIGFAGGKSSFGLKGEVERALQLHPSVQFVRYEVTTSYHTRYRELLMAHIADQGSLPPLNSIAPTGRISPA